MVYESTIFHEYCHSWSSCFTYVKNHEITFTHNSPSAGEPPVKQLLYSTTTYALLLYKCFLIDETIEKMVR